MLKGGQPRVNHLHACPVFAYAAGFALEAALRWLYHCKMLPEEWHFHDFLTGFAIAHICAHA